MIIIQLFFMSSCSTPSNIDTGNKISSPLNRDIPINDNWEVTDYKIFDTSIKITDYSKWIHSKASFSIEAATFGDTFCNKPTYKTKIVDANSYLVYSYKIKPSDLNISSKELKIISITSESNFFHEFIKIDDQHLITNIDGIFFFLKKSSKATSSALTESFSNSDMTENASKTNSGDSGILLTLRSQKKSEYSTSFHEDKDYSYRTIWISYANKKLNPILQTSMMLVPRMTGFWLIQSSQVKNKDNFLDSLNSVPIGAKTIKNNSLLYLSKDKKIINFIGNDYISIEKNLSIPSNTNNDSFQDTSLQTLPIDNLGARESLKINQFIGTNESSSTSGSTAFKEGAVAYLNSLNNSSYFSKDYKLDNWGLFRRNGHWVLKGRLTSFQNLPTDISPDFFIPIVTPKTLVGYDSLYPNWSSIKERVPDAIDAFSSPKKNLLITMSNSILSVYSVNNNNIDLYPLAQVKLKENETVIMDQWGLENYVDIWSKVFNRYDVETPNMVKIN